MQFRYPMTRCTDTYDEAYKACDSYCAEYRALPTVEAIMKATGKNSPATVARAVKDWKDALAERHATAPPHIEGIPDALQSVFVQLWQHTLKAAHLALTVETATTERQLKRQIEDLEAKLKALDVEKARVSIKHDCLMGDLLEANGKANAMQDENNKLKGVLAQAQVEFNKLKEDYERLDKQFNAQNDWYLRQLAQEKALWEKKHGQLAVKPNT